MKKTILILSALLCALSVPAQYSRLPVESTLSNPTVNCMTEADDGYIWIGTRRGLNRFNGSAYKVYYQSDSLSLSNDYIAAMCRDTDGRIWIGTSAGIGLMCNGEVELTPTSPHKSAKKSARIQSIHADFSFFKTDFF